MKRLIVCCTFLLSSLTLISQSNDSKPSWGDFDWMAGDWIGDGFGGISYETWSEPIAGSMLGTYRHVGDGKNTFFELFTISQEENGDFIMKLRHFNPVMTAWEDKSGHLVWEFKEVGEDYFTFGPCTYKKIDDKKMEISLIMKNNGKIKTEKFHFERQ